MHTPATTSRSPFDDDRGPAPAEALADAIRIRAAEWASSIRPNDAFEVFLLEQMAADALRIERCEDHEAELRARAANRAKYYWDNDRRIAVEELAATLRKRPAIVAGKLRGSLYGCQWLLLRWRALAAPLREGKDWSDDQKARALDLLGFADDLRDGPTPADGGPDDRLRLAESKVHELASVATTDGALAMLDHEDYRLVAKGVPALKDPAIEAVRREAERARRRLEWAWNRIRGGRAGLPRAAAPAVVEDETGPDSEVEPETETGSGSEAGPDESARIARAIDRMLSVPVPIRTARTPALPGGGRCPSGGPVGDWLNLRGER